MIKFLDQKNWHPDDKVWMNVRKQEWKHIQKNLKINQGLLINGKGYLSDHKRLFFKGEFDDLVDAGGDNFGRMLALFVIWYHPAINSDICDSLLDYCETHKAAARSIGTSVRLLFELANNPQYDKSYGFMGDRAEWAVKYLCGARARAIVEKYEGSLKFVMSPNSVLVEAGGGVNTVLNGKESSWSPGRYLWSYMLTVFDQATEERNINYLKDVLKKVIFFDEHRSTTKDNQDGIAMKNKITRQFERRDGVSDKLYDLWELAESEGLDEIHRF